MAKYKVALSDGHGEATSGKRTPDGYRENRFNSAVIDLLNVELKRCGFDTKLVAPTDYDTPLKARTDLANSWGADIYVSVHYNALADKWRDGEGGIETFYHEGSAKGKGLATCIHRNLMRGTKLKDRGLKTANLHETRETHMPAALAECGFMDIKDEAELMKSTAYHKECAVEIAKGVCEYFEVDYKEEEKVEKQEVNKPASKPTTTAPKGTMYRVVAGSYSDRANADAQVKALKAKGFTSFIDIIKP